MRGIEADVLPVTQKYGMGVIPWSPLAGGWLTGRYRLGLDAPDSNRGRRADLSTPESQAKLEVVEKLAVLAEEVGVSLVDFSLAFVIRHPAITSAIIGPRTMEQLESQINAPKVTLSTEVLDKIDEIVPPGTNVGGGTSWKTAGTTRRVPQNAADPLPHGGTGVW